MYTGAKQPDSEETGPKGFELQIPADRAGLVIGAGGKNIREVERLTNTIIKVDRGLGVLGGGNRRVLVVGSEENCKKALLIILKKVQRRVDEHTAGVKTISVPDSCVGKIIGKGGATINTIKSISGAQDIKFDERKTGLEAMLQTDRKCYIHGSEEAMEKAEKLIRLAMTGENIVAGATFAAIFMELLKMGVQCQEES
jgi:transcription antitermination factor NusA-like protein